MVDARRTRRMSSMIPQGRRLAAGPTSRERLPVRGAPLRAAPSVTPPAKAILYSEVSRFKM